MMLRTKNHHREGGCLGSPTCSTAEEWRMLKAFTKANFRGLSADYLSTKEQRDGLRSAFMAVYSSPNFSVGWPGSGSTAPDTLDIMFGVMSSDVRMVVRAYRDWCAALGLVYVVPELRIDGVAALADIPGPVYLKYNARSKAAYVSVYFGKDRGVLVQLGQEQLGHFPLGMWDEGQTQPPPEL
ncbi:hypothetical protein FOA52_014338 [Chlamydomonas sp. UWO 241]|nr:hypothetical protein FOA52_014338 [Chlamydomonas sp. UWO 241]